MDLFSFQRLQGDTRDLRNVSLQHSTINKDLKQFSDNLQKIHTFSKILKKANRQTLKPLNR